MTSLSFRAGTKTQSRLFLLVMEMLVGQEKTEPRLDARKISTKTIKRMALKMMAAKK
jgi:hypothetical protein